MSDNGMDGCFPNRTSLCGLGISNKEEPMKPNMESNPAPLAAIGVDIG